MDGCALPMDWAFRQFGSCSLGDKRRTDRAVVLGAHLANNSGESLPVQTGTIAGAKAAYRLLAEPEVTHSDLSSPHWEAVRHRARTPNLGAVLFIQDGTELDYSHHPATTGLGFVGDGRNQGMELQTTLCVLPGVEPELFGMAYSSPWTRDHEPYGKTEKRSARNARHKESDVWGDSVEAIGHAPEDVCGTRWVSVSDRGSDVFSFLTRAKALGWSCLVRSQHDRRVADSHDTVLRLHSFARSMAPVDTFTVELRSRPGKAARSVLLNLAWAPLTLLAPTGTTGEPIAAWCIRVWEEAPVDPLEWILVSTDPVANIQDALEKVEWYRNRWIVEEYHKCLKTGCSMEKRQVSTHQSLQALLGLLGVVAVFLLQLKSRAHPIPIPPSLKTALQVLSKRKLADPDTRDYWREIAMLGGFLGRKGDGQPGWQSIWRGWNRLQDIAIGIEIAAEIDRLEKCG
jgi:hypothetical protein